MKLFSAKFSTEVGVSALGKGGCIQAFGDALLWDTQCGHPVALGPHEQAVGMEQKKPMHVVPLDGK